MHYDERLSRLFLTFNADMTYMELKPEVTDRAVSHDAPVVGAFYSQAYYQVSSFDIWFSKVSEAYVHALWQLCSDNN
jgi:hypothetical protein